MEIDFDPAKDAANRLKHGLSLTLAAAMDWNSLQIQHDMRRDYGETRKIGLGLVGNRLYCVVFVHLAEGLCRIISLRKANGREVREHEKAQDHHADSS